MAFEQTLGSTLYQQTQDKSYIDKLLSRKEVEKLQLLMKKQELTKQDLSEIMYLLSGAELKLSNMDGYDRYLLGKYFTWIRDIIKAAEYVYDYLDKISNEKASDEVIIKLRNHKDFEEIKECLEQIQHMLIHDVKFSVDIFLYLTRSTLGVEGVAFDTLSKGRYEYEYSGNTPPPQQSQDKNFLRR